MIVQPYLMFNGNCEQAVEFYRKHLGAQVTHMMRFKDSPDPQTKQYIAPGTDNNVMHVGFTIGESLIMASDTADGKTGKIDGFSLALSTATADDVRRMFAALSDGGKVIMPLAKTFWSELFGMVTDRFGVSWMVMVAEKKA